MDVEYISVQVWVGKINYSHVCMYWRAALYYRLDEIKIFVCKFEQLPLAFATHNLHLADRCLKVKSAHSQLSSPLLFLKKTRCNSLLNTNVTTPIPAKNYNVKLSLERAARATSSHSTQTSSSGFYSDSSAQTNSCTWRQSCTELGR